MCVGKDRDIALIACMSKVCWIVILQFCLPLLHTIPVNLTVKMKDNNVIESM